MRQSTFFTFLTTALASSSVAAGDLIGFSPVKRGLSLIARQNNQGGCDIAQVQCGDQCFTIGSTCCGDGLTACDIGKVCQVGSDGRYGCCDIGETCTGSAPDSTSALPSPTQSDDNFSVPAFTSATPTASSGGGIGGLPSNTGVNLTPTGSSGSSGVSDACQSDLSSLQAHPIPTMAPDLQSAVGTDLCSFKPPASLSSEWSSYSSAFKSWSNDNQDLIKRLQKDCSSNQQIPNIDKCSGSGSSSGVAKLTNDATGALIAFLVVVSFVLSGGM